MAQILLIYDNSQLAKMYAMNIGIGVGVDVLIKSSLEDAMKLLAVHTNLEMIICKSHLHNLICAQKVYDYLKEQNLQIPMLVLGNNQSKSENWNRLELGIEAEKLTEEVIQTLEIHRDRKQSTVSSFIGADIDTFYAIKNCPCDLYQRSRKSPGEYHYHKKLNKDAELGQNDVLRFQYEGIAQLYIKSEDYDVFVKYFTSAVHSLLDEEGLSAEQRVQVNSCAMKSVANQIGKIGLSKETIITAQKTIKSIVQLTQKIPELKAILDLLFTGRPNFHYNHAQICTYICSHIVRNMDWGTDGQSEKLNVSTSEKLAYVSFFHDVTLIDEKLSRVRSEKELEAQEFSKKEKEQVLNHANEVVVILEKFPNAPIGADIIIRQHHGSRSGVGFPTFFSQDLSPLSMIFIVAQDVTDFLVEANGEKIDWKVKVLFLRERYKSRKYQKIIDTIELLK